MLERTRIVVVCTFVALVLAAGCQSGPKKTDGDKSGESTATPAESTEPEAAPVDTAQGAIETLRTIETDQGEVKVTPLEHGSLMLGFGERTIYVDPTSAALEHADKPLPKGDLVLVTHIHGDHLDPQAISKVRGEGAAVIVPQSVADEAGDALPNPKIIANGETTEAFDGSLEIEAFPMYNLVRKRDNGEFYHPKGRGNAYILTMDGARVYISGDTECTPEMKALEDIDAAFLSMNLPYTMPPSEAAECVRAFEPDVLYPYHFRGQNPEELNGLLGADSEVEVRLLQWYPEGEGAE
jgi:L-ascorbate metabolism protein UlaG (beta-lactamase superfamily)